MIGIRQSIIKIRHALIADRPTLGVYFESRPEIISLIVRRLLDLGLRMSQSPHQAQLIHQAVSGDPAAIGEIFDSYGEAIYLVAHRLMTCPEDAEDVVQDVFLDLPRYSFPLFKIAAAWKYQLSATG